MTILVTGGAGFIGANFVIDWAAQSNEPVVVLDRLTYAGNAINLAELPSDRFELVRGDIGDRDLVGSLLIRHEPRAIVNFAAESHVDRSIAGPAAFIETNVMGTFNLLECTRTWSAASGSQPRFLHVSTDEVYGSLESDAPSSTEAAPYAPNSPYSASKASSDHLVRAYHHTYGLPTLTTNCCNNYGPLQFPEKLIPVVIDRALRGLDIPIYGDGLNRREWLHVVDHCAALRLVLERGTPGACYNIGTGEEVANIDLVRSICALLDDTRPRADRGSYAEFITAVPDRPGHDRRYALNSGKLRDDLGWRPRRSLSEGLRATVDWYVENHAWTASVLARASSMMEVN